MKHKFQLFFIIITFTTTQNIDSIDPKTLIECTRQKDPQYVAADVTHYGLKLGAMTGALMLVLFPTKSSEAILPASIAAGTLSTAIATYSSDQGAPNNIDPSDTQWRFWLNGLIINFFLATALKDPVTAAAVTTAIMGVPYIVTEEENRRKQAIEEWKRKNGYIA